MNTTPSHPSPAQGVAQAAAAPQRPSIEQCLQRAESSRAMGAYIHLARAAAMQRVQALGDLAAASASHDLRGLGVAVKDNIDVAGLPTTAGSPALKGHMPLRSASAVARLQAAGAVVLGKANLHEFCFGITSNNQAFGPVRNPYAPERIAGGSSGGTAAAIAGGMAHVGLGSDTGGSLRIPAALCGVVGFRPTTGRWPSDGVVKISGTRDTVGPMAHRVLDCAMLDAVVCGELPLPAAVSLRGVRIGIPRLGFWHPLEASVAHAAEQVLADLREAGAVLVELDDIGVHDGRFGEAGMVVALFETLGNLENYLSGHGLPFDAARVTGQIASPDVRGIFEHLLSPQAPTRAAYDNAMQVQRPALRAAYARCFAEQRLQALIFPTTPMPAALIGEDEQVVLCGQAVSTFATFTRNVGPGSFAGLPGISLPMGCNDAGLPLGIALDGPASSDRQVLALAAALQALLPPMPPPRQA